MRIFKKLSVVTLASLVAVSMSGCANSFIKPREGVDRVSLAEANQVAACQSKGQVTIKVLAKVGFVVRNADEVEADLLKMAFNGAVDAGADTIVKGDQPEFGKRNFSFYKCRP
jgi:hypothetical protein